MGRNETDYDDRWKVLISDGTYCMWGLCCVGLAKHFRSNKLQKGTIIEVDHFVIGHLNNGSKICVLVDVTVVSSVVEDVENELQNLRNINTIWKSED